MVGLIGKAPSRVRKHMQLFGYDPKSPAALSSYAIGLESGSLKPPAELRGIPKISKNRKYCWDRMLGFIALHKHGVDFEELAKHLKAKGDEWLLNKRMPHNFQVSIAGCSYSVTVSLYMGKYLRFYSFVSTGSPVSDPMVSF